MRAISKNTRKATAITLAAALVIAVYLNWQYARTGVTLEEDAVNVSAVSQESIPVTDEPVSYTHLKELGIPTPYNEYTYHMIKAMEEKNDGLFDYDGTEEPTWAK